MIFHAHCLNPYRFYADINRRGRRLWKRGIAFPSERLASLIQKDIWSDDDSEGSWLDLGDPVPYQLWETDPKFGGEFRLQDIEIYCAWCRHFQFIPCEEFAKMHINKQTGLKCGACNVSYNADTLSAKFFVDDLCDFLKEHNPWYDTD
jgi:hypothetical protein